MTATKLVTKLVTKPLGLPLALLLALAGGACAPSALEVRDHAGGQDLAATEAEQQRLDAELTALTVAAAPPDCHRVCELAGNVCALAGRICALVPHGAAPASDDARCRDGQGRCLRAIALAHDRCGCAPQPPR